MTGSAHDEWLGSDDRLASWAMEVVEPTPRELGDLAEWAADVTEPQAVPELAAS